MRRRLWAPPVPEADAWQTDVGDPRTGTVRLTGRLSTVAGSRRLVIGVHGLGGSAESRYLWELASTAVASGWSMLRLNLRGADRRGDDFYHGGLTADLHAALASPALGDYEEIVIAGYSLGGHVALCIATEEADPRLRAVAAICPPLDLAAGQQAIDRGRSLYRWYVMNHLHEIYRECAARRPGPISVAEANRITRLWDWDERIVAPRYGFAGAADYYRRVSVAARFEAGHPTSRPTLVVATTGDPMVPVATLRSRLETPIEGLDVRWVVGGGHVAFPRLLDLGFEGSRGLAGQLLAWFEGRVG